MTLLEEAGQLLEQALDSLRRGRTQAAADYLKQARKLYDADFAAVMDENLHLERQVVRLTTQLDDLNRRGNQPQAREHWRSRG